MFPTGAGMGSIFFSELFSNDCVFIGSGYFPEKKIKLYILFFYLTGMYSFLPKY